MLKCSRFVLLILSFFFISFNLYKVVAEEQVAGVKVENKMPQEFKNNTKVNEGAKEENKIEEKKITIDSNTLKDNGHVKNNESIKNSVNKSPEGIKPPPPKAENKAPIPKKKKSNENKSKKDPPPQNLDTPSTPIFEEKSNNQTLPENLNDKDTLEEIPDSINNGLEKRSYVIRGIISMMLVVAGAVLLVIVIVSGYEKKNKKA